MNWFYIDESILEGERRQGPVQLADLQALQEQNKINDTTLVWHKGLDNWISWKEAREKEAENDPQANELLLRETVESILRERAEEWQQRAYAGFFIRAAAFLIDWILIAVLWEISAQILGKFSVLDLAASSEAANALIEKYTEDPSFAKFSTEFSNIPGMTGLSLLWLGIQTIYFVGFNGFLSATPGKLLFRLKIERADHHALKLSGAVVRYIFSLLTQATLIFYGIGYILAIIDPQKRTLHDFFAKTRVVYAPKSESKSKPENSPED